MRILEQGGDWAKALNWNEEITKHNQRIYKQEQAKKDRQEQPDTDADMDDDKELAFSFPTFDRSNYYGIAGEIALLASTDSEADPTIEPILRGRRYSRSDSKSKSRFFIAITRGQSKSMAYCLT